jgi:hypothetical protein
MLRFDEFANEKNEVKEAPVKPKEKEKEKERTTTNPNEKPSVDPWKRRPNIKPGEEPKPKAKLVLENKESGKINSTNGMAFATFEKTEDEVGYNVELTFQGSVIEADLPTDWQDQLTAALNEAEELIMKKLTWLE